MVQTYTVLAIGAVVLLAIVGYYVAGVVSNIRTANVAVGQDNVIANAKGVLANIDARLSGWKTVILAWVAGLAQVYNLVSESAVQAWGALPWAQVVDAKVANWITFLCAAAIPIVHAHGLKNAAQATPTERVDQ